MKIDFMGAVRAGVEKALCEQELKIGMTLKEAVEKQVEKPVRVEVASVEGIRMYLCPCCGKRITSRFCGQWIAGRLQKFCDECGQKIDWTEQEGQT